MPTETSELFAVDIALGNHLINAFSGMSATYGPSEFREFAGRDGSLQVFRHDCDTPQEFLKAYFADAKAQTTSTGATGARVSVPRLPVVQYCRKPGLVSNDEYTTRYWKERHQLIVNAVGPVIGELRFFMFTLTYRLALFARDKASLDRLILAWFAHVSDRRGGKDKFDILYQITGNNVQEKAYIRDAKSCNFADESVTDESGHYFVASTMVEVDAPVIVGQAVTIVEPVTLQFAGEIING